MIYRRYYEKKCNIKIPKGYEVHHIDFNRENNDIMNLVLLPKELHKKYHKLLKQYKSITYKVVTKLQSPLEMGHAINNYILYNDMEIIKDFILIWYECINYVYYRDIMLELIPNVIEIKDKVLLQAILNREAK